MDIDVSSLILFSIISSAIHFLTNMILFFFMAK